MNCTTSQQEICTLQIADFPNPLTRAYDLSKDEVPTSGTEVTVYYKVTDRGDASLDPPLCKGALIGVIAVITTLLIGWVVILSIVSTRLAGELRRGRIRPVKK